MRAAFGNVFGATIFFGTDTFRGTARFIHRSRFNFLREAQIWYTGATISEEFENVIVLSDEFFQEVTAHPIPTDLEAVRVLAASPAVLDLFMWLSYRCFPAEREEAIPIFEQFGLAAQLGNVEYARPRKFREKLEQWLRAVRVMWPECPAYICSTGNEIRVANANAIRPSRTLIRRHSVGRNSSSKMLHREPRRQGNAPRNGFLACRFDERAADAVG